MTNLSKNKKILLIIPSLRHGGAERVISVLANEWAQKPELQVFLLILTKQTRFYALAKNINVIEPEKDYKRNFLSKLLYSYWIIKFIKKNVQEINPDSILSFCERYNNIVLLALKFTNYKIFISDRNNPAKYLGIFHENLRKKLYRKATGVIAQTHIGSVILTKKTGNKNIVTIPNPLRKIEVHPISKEKIILNVGRNEPQKNQVKLIEMFASLKNAADWKLYILGNGALRSTLIQKVDELNLNNRVCLLDFRTDVDYYFQKASIFAFSSLHEGFPNALSEALANGLPCVSYDCPTGPAELIIDNKNGFLVPLNDEALFIEKMQFLVDHSDARLAMGMAAKDVKTKLGVNVIAERYLKTILN